MKRYLLWTILLATFLASPAHGQSDVQKVAKQFDEYCLQEESGRGDRLLDDVDLPKNKMAEVQRLTATMRADGAWDNIDYKSDDRAAWPSYGQLTRLLSMSVYAQWRSTKPDERAKTLTAIHRGLAYWMQHDPKNPNWWYNEIGVPKIMGTIGLILGDELKPDEKKYITDTIMPRSKVGSMTGQNRVWLAANGVMRAAMLDDEKLMREAADVIADELRVADKVGVEGVQADWSFHQHGPQQQFGNYGMAYAVELSRWASVLRGTKFALPPEKLDILRHYLLQGQNWVTWNGVMDVSSCGRQISPNSPIGKANSIRAVMETMIDVDPARKDDYAAYVKRNSPGGVNDLIGDRFFWRSDYLIHRSKQMFVSVRMNSSRTIGGETVNSENLSGQLLCDGATFTYMTGQEYADIYPAWDWHKIPGVTSELNNKSLRWPEKKEPVKQDFVGGIDGDGAVACMDFSREGLSAKKAWFCLGDTVVCLGADIRSSDDWPIVTTIEQCLLKGKIQAGKSKQTFDVPLGSQKLSADWVQQDQLRYTFFEPLNLSIEAGKRVGNWKSVYDTASTPKEDVSRDVFTLWINHDAKKVGSYAYAVNPISQTTADVKVVQNDATAQAVQIADWCGVVFWKAGKIERWNVAVDQPCVMLIRRTAARVADPSEKLSALHVEMNGLQHNIKLPTGTEAGEGVNIQ